MRPVRDIFRSYAVFDAEGRHTNGTDKESNHHYGDAYEHIIDETWSYVNNVKVDSGKAISCNYTRGRAEVKLMMEIGIADGSSLLAWREVFPNALCVGMDIHHSDKAHGDRIEFNFGDQRLKADCEAAAKGRMFDFIVEDATHQIENTLLTLYWMWPFVRPGGLYVVEEWDGVDRERIRDLWSCAEIVDTQGPFGGVEPLVVFRKPT